MQCLCPFITKKVLQTPIQHSQSIRQLPRGYELYLTVRKSIMSPINEIVFTAIFHVILHLPITNDQLLIKEGFIVSQRLPMVVGPLQHY
jgi:hypothetical protein